MKQIKQVMGTGIVVKGNDIDTDQAFYKKP